MKRKVLVIDFEESSRDEIGALLEEMGYPYLEARDGEEALAFARSEKIGLVITNIFVQSVTLIELLMAIQRIHRNAETVVYSKSLNGATLELVRDIGVFRVIKKPFEYSELRNVIATGYASRRIFRMAVIDRLMHSNEPRRPSVLLAHSDTNVFEDLLRLLLTSGLKVECAKDPYHLAEKLMYSCYDAVVACKPFLDGIVIRKSSFNFIRKPFAFVVKNQRDKKEKESKNYEVCFSGVHWIEYPADIAFLGQTIEEGLRSRARAVAGGPWRGFVRRTRNYIYAVRATIGSFGLVLGASVIILSVLCGYIAGAIFSRPPRQPEPVLSTPELEMLRQLQLLKQLQSTQKKEQIPEINPEDLLELQRRYGK